MPRLCLCLLLLGAPASVCAAADDGSDSETAPSHLFDRIASEARALSDKPYQPKPHGGVPQALADLDYAQYRNIRFRSDHALWNDQSLFRVELFHPGFLYRRPVTVHVVDAGAVHDVEFSRDLFRYDLQLPKNLDLSSDLGFAGFRLHYPINKPDYADEVIAFLGASYFRMIGRGQIYGASARGLAIDTALPKGEEFPRFREFWLIKPEPGAQRVTFFALLDSQSVTGVYRFEVDPGARTVLDVKCRLFARADIQRLGIAPLTSMFRSGENSAQPVDDFRGEIHDSDGLLIHGSDDQWIWRPLTNPDALRVSALQAENPLGFGLAQRDREFDHYLDIAGQFEKRPGLWVQPLGEGWGKGAIDLIEIPTDKETNDNIVAFWEPETPLKAGDSVAFHYRLSTFAQTPSGHERARVLRTRIGRGGIPGTDRPTSDQQRRFVIDFTGDPLEGLAAAQPVRGKVTSSSGEVADVHTRPLPGGRGWRLSFQLRPQQDQPTDLTAELWLRDERLTERWNYVWYSDGNP